MEHSDLLNSIRVSPTKGESSEACAEDYTPRRQSRIGHFLWDYLKVTIVQGGRIIFQSATQTQLAGSPILIPSK